NGNNVNEHVVWSEIHNNGSTSRSGAKPRAALTHYLFCKYGIVEVFIRFAETDIVIGDVNSIAPLNYDPDHWNICAPNGKKPWGSRLVNMATSTLRVAIRKEQWTHMTSGMVAALFYIAGFFPDRVIPEHMFHSGTHELESVNDEIRLWRILLGHVIWG